MFTGHIKRLGGSRVDAGRTFLMPRFYSEVVIFKLLESKESWKMIWNLLRNLQFAISGTNETINFFSNSV